MKVYVLFFVTLLSVSSYGADTSEMDGPLMDRVVSGCQKYADKQAAKHIKEHFNMNFWSGGNVGQGSIDALEDQRKGHANLLSSQCINMVAEILEMKLGYAPWQTK